MAERDLSRLCRSVLPPGFEEASRELPKLQRFIENNLPEVICDHVTVLAVDAEQIVLGGSTPMVTNYLRLHGDALQQQLREALQLQQTLRFRTVPDALLQPRKPVATPPPQPVSEQSVEAIRRNADWIEDESLRAAMLALADSMQNRTD